MSVNFEPYFKMISYSVVLCGMFALFFSGGIGIWFLIVFSLTATLAWFLEGTHHQISERWGLTLLILAAPIFYLNWKHKFTNIGEFFAAGNLAQLILFLCAIKLLQKKSDRDWIFLYIISFFEMLLAAGLSISLLYLLALFAYLFCTTSAIIAFEIRRSSHLEKNNDFVDKNEGKWSQAVKFKKGFSQLRLLSMSFFLLVFITIFAIPLFFAFPRFGGAFLTGNDSFGETSISGFSDKVRLGEIGRLKLNEETVMRVRLKGHQNVLLREIYWRGAALDQFDNKSWSRSNKVRNNLYIKSNNGFFSINKSKRNNNNVKQIFYLEPISSSVLFSMSKPISIRGNFRILKKDAEDAIRANQAIFKRTNYIVHSDTSLPEITKLRLDNSRYFLESMRYLNLPPKLDVRVSELTKKIISDSKAGNRYDIAKSIEAHLRTQFGYTLELKAGGEEPLVDFLFNIKEGHCEYFATAMAIMLRTQGIATRIVNGFQQGDYNSSADMYVVKQRDAHSWVEVYFPSEDAWVPFDPTPVDGRFNTNINNSVAGGFTKLLESLEIYWIQYFVSYDSQEQNSLFQSAQNSFSNYKNTALLWFEHVKGLLGDWWQRVRGDSGFEARIMAIVVGVVYTATTIIGGFFVIWICKRIKRLRFWAWLKLKQKKDTIIIDFYERMQRTLTDRGVIRKPYQTPLEFAYALNIPEAIKVTEKYNRVRFGEKNLSKDEFNEIENWLKNLEESRLHGTSS